MRRHAARLWLLFLVGTLPWAQAASQAEIGCGSWKPGMQPQLYGYQVVAEYPHDPKAFTQGLVFDRKCYDNKTDCKEVFWESTGMYGASDVRLVHLDTGAPLMRTRMEARWFGEGLAKHGDLLYQITWQGPQGFIYNTRDLKQVGTFTTPLRDGWGIAEDGRLMVLSDGGANLTWVDPNNGFRRVRSVVVRDNGRRVRHLNELEVIDGEVWANVWQTPCIARICPATGAVRGWLLMQGLWEALARRNLPMQGKSMDVLNGIAWDAARRRLFVTGKYWPRIFEVVPQPLNMADPAMAARAKAAAAACLV
ncbi:MAG: glutamine cyclotransferase precursor-like protein [Monoraphidium minutum]|nr:MAG: glutamine cyclotransferase precursor-like protein [Monoraphidium minutum]